MVIEFVLDIEPFSVNRYHYRDKRHKTAEAREWEATVEERLQKLPMLASIADVWRKNGGHFVLQCTAMYYKSMFYTESGEISGRTHDITNWEKPLQDMIFKQMGLNDKLVKKLISEKGPGDYPCIKVRLELNSNANTDVALSIAKGT